MKSESQTPTTTRLPCPPHKFDRKTLHARYCVFCGAAPRRIGARGSPTTWFYVMDEALIIGRRAGMSHAEVAEKIGVTPFAVATRLIDLGLPRGALGRGRISGKSVQREKLQNANA